jgi:hypothetical protein
MAAASGAGPAPRCCGPAVERTLVSHSQLGGCPFAARWPDATKQRTVSNCMHMVPGKTRHVLELWSLVYLAAGTSK